MQPDRITNAYRVLKDIYSSAHSEMEQVRAAYMGEVELPLPGLNKAERAAVPNIFQLGIDQMGSRVASVNPDVYFAAQKPGSDKWEKVARQQRQVALGWLEANDYQRKARRRARHLLGFATSPIVIRPNDEMQGPKWFVRSPLATYAFPGEDPDSIRPSAVIFAFRRNREWLEANYADQLRALRQNNDKPVQEFTVLEYLDGEEDHLLLLSEFVESSDQNFYEILGSQQTVTLDRTENRAGVCPVVMPGQPSLDRIRSRFYGVLGMYMEQAELFALAKIATKQAVFPELWFLERTNEQGEIITPANAMEGIPGEAKGYALQPIQQNPGFMTNPMIDRLYQYAKTTAGIPNDMTGESGSNIRTGRRGEALLSAQIDFIVQENQAALAESLGEEMKIAIAIDKAYFGSRPKSVYVSVPDLKGPVTYTANRLWEWNKPTVKYAMLGADQNQLIVGIGQRRGLELMSQRTAMSLDPYVDDPETELDNLAVEAMRNAVMAEFLQPTGDPGAMLIKARAAELVESERLSPTEAILRVQREAQERQATAGEPGTPTGPVAPGSPEAQSGIAQPGQGQEAGTTVAPPTPSLANLGSVMGTLWRGGGATLSR